MANMLAAGLLFLGVLHSLEVITPAAAVDGKHISPMRTTTRSLRGKKKLMCWGVGGGGLFMNVLMLIIAGFVVRRRCTERLLVPGLQRGGMKPRRDN